jgi:hypothetical protein
MNTLWAVPSFAAIQHLADWIQSNELLANIWSLVLGTLWALSAHKN